MEEEPESLHPSELRVPGTPVLESGLDETGLHEAPWAGRKWLALGLLAAVAGLAWETMDPGKLRSVVLLLLAFFAVRILLAGSASR